MFQVIEQQLWLLPAHLQAALAPENNRMVAKDIKALFVADSTSEQGACSVTQSLFA